MERLLNDGWRFARLPLGSTQADAMRAEYAPVDLPHDFLIGQADDLYQDADGWYRRTLTVPEDYAEHVWLMRFDGVYMDCEVLVNGQCVAVHRYGYTAFDAPLTPYLHAGDNDLAVHIRHQSPNTRWYSGAGIYRDVTLHVLPRHYIPLDGVYVHTQEREGGLWEMDIQVELAGEPDDYMVEYRLLDMAGEVIFEHAQLADGDVCGLSAAVEEPEVWRCERPYLYTLEVKKCTQVVRQRIGFKTVEMRPAEGLFLNGEKTKLHGVCLHHDLGALGAAFHEKAARRQLRCMREMGVNALRTSHNPPARQVLDLCDEMGIFVVDEAFDMWERPKTAYDYARFFGECVAADVAAWVRRDRNHPCLLMWSIGNEILDTHLDARGVEVTRLLKGLVEKHDPLGNAVPTIGSNYMPWEGARKCADVLKIAGYNYGEKYYERDRREHPDWVIYGSETASVLSSRGVYHFPKTTAILCDEDLQCSALGNSSTSWGAQDLGKLIADDLNCPYSMGQFLWSGIDYIGEPTPYHTRSCYFGQMDTACFPKDAWYQFRAAWTDAPMAHIGVHWDWNPGQMIDVPVSTNGAACELILNGRSLGRKAVDRLDAQRCQPVWQVPFEKGELRAKAYDAQGEGIAEDVARTFGDSAALLLTAEDTSLLADGHDMTFVTIRTVDQDGIPVENACDRVHVRVSGAGRLLGLDNGDATDRDGYKTTTRRLFSGKLLAMVGALDAPGVMRVEVTSPGLAPAVLELPAVACEKRPGVSCVERIADAPMPQERPARRIELMPVGPRALSPEQPDAAFTVRVLPEDADAQEVRYRVTTVGGIDSPCAEVEETANGVILHAKGDGHLLLRATCTNGYPHTRVISQQEIDITGLGTPYLDPYGFITGGLYDLSDGDIAPGNEQGFAFARDGYSMAGFTNVDFGPVGSDEITLPIFTLNGDLYEIGLYLGDPREDGRKLAVLPYQKPSIWNVYQPETYKLPERITGVQTICFTMTEKIHVKGFSFTRQSRAWLPQTAAQADAIYGDTFTRAGDAVLGIGNNVTLEYRGMDFGGAAEAELVIDGATPLTETPVNVRIEDAAGEVELQTCAFQGTARGEQTFRVPVLNGVCTVQFVFLPGAQFDFYHFQFKPIPKA